MTLLYRALLDHLRVQVLDEETLVHVDYYEICFWYSRSPSDVERERVLADCFNLIEHPVVQQDPRLRYRLHEKIGQYHFFKKAYDHALQSYEAAIASADSVQDQDAGARILCAMSETADAAGDFERALALANEAATRAYSIEQKARSSMQVGVLLRDYGKLELAEERLMASHALWQQACRTGASLPYGLAESQLGIATLYILWARLREALQWVKKAKASTDRVLSVAPGDLHATYLSGRIASQEARVHTNRGRPDRAYDLIKSVLPRCQNLQHSYRDFRLFGIYGSLGNCCFALNRPADAVGAFGVNAKSRRTPAPKDTGRDRSTARLR